MGQLTLYDAFQSKYYNTDDFTLFTLEDVDRAVGLMRQLKYSQHQVLEHGRGTFEIEVTPYGAGHMIGGCFWRFK